MPKLEAEAYLMYKSLPDKYKRRVRAFINGMLLATKNTDELTDKEKAFVRVYVQVMRTLRKKDRAEVESRSGQR